MSDTELRAAQLTAHARFRAESQKLDEDLSLPFSQTTEQRIARGKRLSQYKLPEVVETSEEMAARLAARDAQIAAELDAIRNPPLEQKFARIVGEDYAGCRLETFRIGLTAEQLAKGEQQWPQDAMTQAKSVLGRLSKISGSIREAVRSGVGLVLCGAPGVGKDHLAAGMMWAALGAGLTCKWTNGGKFAALAMDQFSDNRQLDKIWLEDWTKPDVLTISDPDGNRQHGLTDHVRDTLYKVVDARVRDGKPTWITINGSDAKVWVERLGARTWDRLVNKAWVLHCNWPGHRKMRGQV